MIVVTNLIFRRNCSLHDLEDMALIATQVPWLILLLLVVQARASYNLCGPRLSLELVLGATWKSDKNLALLSRMVCVFLFDLLEFAPSAMLIVSGRVGNIHDSNSQSLRQAYAAF